MVKAIIFDMDGVLIDSQPLHYEIDIRVLKTCGYNATLDTVTPYTGISNPDRWQKYKHNLNLDTSVDKLIQLAEEAMRDIFNHTHFTAIGGIPDLLKGIKSLGLPCGVASSSSHELIQLVLSRTGIGAYFDVLTSGEDVKNGKPAPDIYLKATKAMGFSPEACIAFEDATPGICAAKNAGLTCIAYKNPNTHGQDFARADFVINHYNEALPIIKAKRG
ncbi:MAG: HAD family phosphatase [Defluviitaleaceae bacterium]|nr:HAD family phosphatase [Defluviitaleaceae bacterium]